MLEPLDALATTGEIELEQLPVDASGRVDPDAVAARMRPTTGLVRVMLANHELGTLEPVAEIARGHARARGVLAPLRRERRRSASSRSASTNSASTC